MSMKINDNNIEIMKMKNIAEISIIMAKKEESGNVEESENENNQRNVKKKEERK